MAQIFDTHAHYDDEAFAGDYREVIAAFPQYGIGRCTDVASTMESVDRVLSLAHEFPNVYAALGIHPSECWDLTEAFLEEMEQKTRDPKVVAIGEIGLDYHFPEEDPDPALQKKWFVRQLVLAQKTGLPVIIHSRDAAKDTFDILQEYHSGLAGGVIHCYSYSTELAREFVKLGFYLGIGGVLTFKNARKIREVVRDIPLTSLVLETDCPYMAPVPHRGERNSSLFLPLVAQAVADCKGIDPEEVIAVTEQNAERLYHV